MAIGVYIDGHESPNSVSVVDSNRAVVDVATQEKQDGILFYLCRIAQLLTAPAALDAAQNRTRGTVAVESGTVTTVTTVTTLTNIGSYSGNAITDGQLLSAWSACVRSRLS